MAEHKVSIVGAGYVGLTAAVCFSAMGHDVRCLETDLDRVEDLASGHCPIHEAGMVELLESGLRNGTLRFGSDAAEMVSEAEFVFLCVPTPSSEDGSTDLRFLESAARSISKHLEPGTVVVNKSTVPIGAVAHVSDLIGRTDISVASNPEFLREGTAVSDFLHPDRIVIGSDDDAAIALLTSLFASIDAPLVVTDPVSAELIKYASNAYLAVRLTFVNEIARLCDDFGADSIDVLAGMGRDHRIGPNFLVPGPGWGGSCFPKDTLALLRTAEQVSDGFPILESALATNESHFDQVVAKTRASLGRPISDSVIAVWGLAFKAGTDDLRESPALKIIDRLLGEGATVQAFDPVVSSIPGKEESITFAASALDAADNADALLVLTEWAEFAEISPDRVRARMRGRAVIDGRNLLDSDRYRRSGLSYKGLGR